MQAGACGSRPAWKLNAAPTARSGIAERFAQLVGEHFLPRATEADEHDSGAAGANFVDQLASRSSASSVRNREARVPAISKAGNSVLSSVVAQRGEQLLVAAEQEDRQPFARRPAGRPRASAFGP